MPSRAGSSFDMKATLRIYEEDLRELPVEMVREAIRDFRQGKLGNGRFCPTAAEIGMAVREKLAARATIDRNAARQDELDRETMEARRRAEARNNPDSIEARQALVENLLGDWKRERNRVNDAKEGPGTQAEAAARVAAWEAGAPQRPVKTFSDKLVSQLKGETPIGAGTLGPRALAKNVEAAE